jgi:hypothetical protein
VIYGLTSINFWTLRVSGRSSLIALSLRLPKIVSHCREQEQLYYCRFTQVRNSRVQGHGIRIVLYALVGLVTVVVLLK